MRRFAVKTALWLMIGAIANLVATWSLSLAWNPYAPERSSGMDESNQWLEPAPRHWPTPLLRFQSTWMTTTVDMVVGGAGLTIIQEELDKQVVQMRVRTGLPFRSMQWTLNQQRPRGTDPPFASSFRSGLRLPVRSGREWRYNRLPIHPIWPGFTANAVLFGTVMWVMWAIPRCVRRSRRRRRGLCVRCAYPIPDRAKPCPECGRDPITGKSAASAVATSP